MIKHAAYTYMLHRMRIRAASRWGKDTVYYSLNKGGRDERADGAKTILFRLVETAVVNNRCSLLGAFTIIEREYS